MAIKIVDGSVYASMIKCGAANLSAHAKEIDDLNVFPIPDGDTGDNMLLTMRGGVKGTPADPASLSATAAAIADGMLLGARGNSGVILSQFFDGISRGLATLSTATVKEFAAAVESGVKQAYSSVLEPTEGTILTVARLASSYADNQRCADLESYLEAFISEAEITLERTPDMLDVLKEAGVVDSGGAGLIQVVKGMLMSLRGMTAEEIASAPAEETAGTQELDLDLFTADSELEFGYCTELLIRLQNRKTDVEHFDVSTITDYLQTIGNSVVCFKTGSIVKLHVHTMTPDKVMAFCQQYGEFLKIKIENMTLQHSNLDGHKEEQVIKEHSVTAVVACCLGEGIQQTFKDLGATEIVNGGQTLNPSAETFLSAFKRANADNIIVLPNNGNVVMAAKQAASLFEGSRVFVVESHNLGQGYAALQSYDPDFADVQETVNQMTEAMASVVTGEVTRSVRDTTMQNVAIEKDDYIAISGSTLLSCEKDQLTAVTKAVDALGISSKDICILIRGKGTQDAETEAIENHIRATCRFTELYTIDGGQEMYSYIIIGE